VLLKNHKSRTIKDKNMNAFIKLSIILLLLTIGTESFAQTIGIKAGLILSNMLKKEHDNTYSDDFKMNPGFHFGPTIEIPISKLFSFESGLMLSFKRYKKIERIRGGEHNSEWEAKAYMLNFDMPLTAKATFDVGGAKIFETFGPYIGMGLCGKFKSKKVYIIDEENISFGSNEEEDHLRRLDYGLTAGAGIKLNSIQIGISFGLGLANLSNNNTEGLSQINNHVLGISVDYKFEGK
jgi:hypothetical protein